jgi:hypothetical protein
MDFFLSHRCERLVNTRCRPARTHFCRRQTELGSVFIWKDSANKATIIPQLLCPWSRCQEQSFYDCPLHLYISSFWPLITHFHPLKFESSHPDQSTKVEHTLKTKTRSFIHNIQMANPISLGGATTHQVWMNGVVDWGPLLHHLAILTSPIGSRLPQQGCREVVSRETRTITGEDSNWGVATIAAVSSPQGVVCCSIRRRLLTPVFLLADR